MKKNVCFLMLFNFLFLGSLYSATITDKTFLLPQPIRVPTSYLAYDYFREVDSRKIKSKSKLLGGSLSVTSVFRRDQNKKDVGIYFGRAGNNVISVGTGKTDFHSVNLIYSNSPQNLSLKGDLELLPYRKIRGVYLNYVTRIPAVSKKLLFFLKVPFVHVTSRLNARVNGQTKKIMPNGTTVGILDYFSGSFGQNGDPVKQENLKYGKIRKFGHLRKEGLGDLELSLRYNFVDTNQCGIRPFIGVILPTSNKPKGEYIFEPIIGNGKKLGIMGGLDAVALLYEEDKMKIDVSYSCCLKVLFSNTQKRMISFRSYDLGSQRSWDHYYGFLGEDGKRGVFPAANVLTRDMKISHNFVFDFLVNYNMFYRNWFASVGYNFFSRSAESGRVKEWFARRYAIVNPLTYNTDDPFKLVDDPAITDHNREGPIQLGMLDPSAACTPASISHKVYGLVSHCWDSLRVPVTVGLGGAYEFTQSNAALEGFECFVNVGCLF